MTRRLIVRVQAEADVLAAAIWYHEERAGLGDEFMAEVAAAIEQIAANPRMHRRLRRRPEVRRALLGRFPYRVFFVVRSEVIVVIRILHDARHERTWRSGI